MTHGQSMYSLAARVLGVEIDALENEIRYAYYRLMSSYHPDKNQGRDQDQRRAALVNEAKDVLLGREDRPNLLNDSALVAEVLNTSVTEEEVRSYEQWLGRQFFNLEQCSIWPY